MTVPPPLPHYNPAPAAKEDMDWAESPVVDLSIAASPEGREILMPLVRDAIHTHGFMYVINHGLTPAQNQRILDIADIPFTQVGEDEKGKHESKTAETGIFRGYKPRKYLHVANDVYDSIEHYNIHHTVNDGREHPVALGPFLPEIRAFNEFNHFHVLYPILRLLALGLELPENTFTDLHPFDDSAALTWCRFTKYFPYESDEDAQNVDGLWLKGHADLTSLTILWSQPVAGLQISDIHGTWRWVRHIDNSLVINIGESMQMLSGGFYPAVIHRVVQPPPSQRGYTRLGVFYFVTAGNDIKLEPLVDSAVLKQTGISSQYANSNAPTQKEWVVARTKTFGLRNYELPTQSNGDSVEEVMEGIFTAHYK